MAIKTSSFKNKTELQSLFNKTFKFADDFLPDGIVRGTRKNITPLVLYEAIAVGIADAISSKAKIDAKKLIPLLDDAELNRLTTGATNSRTKLMQRINYVKERLTS